MLEYRDFPLKTALNYILFAPAVSYCIYIIVELITGQLYQPAIDNHMPLLGMGALAAAVTIPVIGLAVDRVGRSIIITFVGAILPVLFYFIGLLLGFPNAYSPIFEYAFVMSAFSGLVLIMASWAVVLNRTIVVRFRGRVVSAFLAIALSGAFLILFLKSYGVPLQFFGVPLVEVSVLVCVILAAALKPWRLIPVPLAVTGNPMRYFFPTAFIMAAYMLWYFSTQLVIQTSLPGFESLSLYAGIPEMEPVFLIGGVVVAGLMADRFGRKTTFSIAIFLMGFLTIFGSVFYYTDPVTLTFHLIPVPLLAMERVIEGFLLGLCLLLIWTELGSPLTKGIRLASVWLFFLGFMCLFWAIDLRAWGWTVPPFVSQIGGQFAILLSLISLYWSGHLPSILGREVEMEDLDLDFDDKLIDQTVDAFLGKDDFESVEMQTESDASSELSEDELIDILGEDFSKMLPLRRIPGVGATLEKKLIKAGYESADQLAGERWSKLASEVEGLGEARARKLIAAARETVHKALESEKK